MPTSRFWRKGRRWLVAIALGWWMLPAVAHDGPPYPILVDRVTPWGPLSIWTDPNVGIGTFMLMLDSQTEKNWASELTVQGPGQRNLEGPHVAVPSPELERGSGRVVLVAKVPFASEGIWRVNFHLHDPQGANLARQDDISLDVSVTPPGPSRTEFTVYFLPFLLLGAVWIIAVIRKRHLGTAARGQAK